MIFKTFNEFHSLFIFIITTDIFYLAIMISSLSFSTNWWSFFGLSSWLKLYGVIFTIKSRRSSWPVLPYQFGFRCWTFIRWTPVLRMKLALFVSCRYQLQIPPPKSAPLTRKSKFDERWKVKSVLIGITPITITRVKNLNGWFALIMNWFALIMNWSWLNIQLSLWTWGSLFM